MFMCVRVYVRNYFLLLDLAKQTQTSVIDDFHYYSAIYSVRS